MMRMTKGLFLFFFSLFFYSCNAKQLQEQPLPTDLTTQLRAPAYPLVTVDPYFNAWAYSDNLYDDQPRHWTDKEFPLMGGLRVDGKVYRFLGKEKLPLRPILPSVHELKWEGRYTFTQPEGDEWLLSSFDDSSWKLGMAAFGTEHQPNLSTPWDTKDIWVRRRFSLDEDLTDKELLLHYSHDDLFTVYINGIRVVETGYSWNYDQLIELSAEVKATLRKGENIITAHCHNRTGGGYLDFGLYERQPELESFTRAAEQKSVSVLPTQTIYRFDCGPVELDVIFTSPLLMDDLELVSRPVNYLSYQVRSKDDQTHEVQLYLEATPQWAVHDDFQPVGYEQFEKEGMTYLKSGTLEQPLLKRKGDFTRIDWGYFYLAGSSHPNRKMGFGDYWETKSSFEKNGDFTPLPAEQLPAQMNESMSVLAFREDMGRVTNQTKAGYIMLGYDDVYSLQYFGANLKGYWTQDGTIDILQAFGHARDEYASLMQRCDAFNRELMRDAEEAGGRKYAELCALAYRQAIAAHKLVKDEEGELLFLSKENNSNGSIGTVDVAYPASPLFLLYNTSLLKGMLNPIFHYSESGRWTKPFPSHDVGTYPLANGQTYGGDMPVEESGNMLIMTGAIAVREGNANYAAEHWEVLTTWADYLVKEGLDPDNQLCTDDFAGHFAHNANLSIKAIMGIASYARMAEMLGKEESAQQYMAVAAAMATEWERMARDGDHYKLTFDRPGTWSIKYNIVWDQLLGFDIFDPQIVVKEMAHYRTVQNRYGLPLDNRANYAKSDWVMWTATLTGNRDDFEALVDPIYHYANETSSRVPISDWHDTENAQRMNFKARSVVGGFFMKLLNEKMK